MFSEEMFSEENLIEDFSNEPMIEENSIPKRPPPDDNKARVLSLKTEINRSRRKDLPSLKPRIHYQSPSPISKPIPRVYPKKQTIPIPTRTPKSRLRPDRKHT